ncbi:STAS domain-containing protein [Candidatus Desulforudis audaxviator]|uniref:Anti-sigma-factor antagonist n=1 Tax=Desulforudis audaxviator (strain MP104C) TaxID=477974 RepID=B1I2F9_DESAP|nr:STAS domain-containing protein [Candidatus Desulforudis audaxviator]ACA59224.1 anti-sigma-factor antagonist [Candidatus Desulforudis audaxviator MP104C]AZK59300.1 RsbR, positive regulator of sigma-B [Candidatus Desulforudis audaxviator]
MDNNLVEMLVEELEAGSKNEEKLWRELLLEVVSGATGNNLREAIREPLFGLLQELGETALGAKLKLVIERVPTFPTAELLLLVMELWGERHRERDQIQRELERMLSELATPIIRIWREILLLPLIGGLDSDRAQGMAERLLDRVSATRARVVVVDVTGVPTIDTVAGGFLIETFSAVKLLGTEVILTGLKPEIAHTLVKLGIDFRMVAIARDLEDALRQAIAMIEEDRSRQRKIVWARGSNFPGEGGEHDGI